MLLFQEVWPNLSLLVVWKEDALPSSICTSPDVFTSPEKVASVPMLAAFVLNVWIVFEAYLIAIIIPSPPVDVLPNCKAVSSEDICISGTVVEFFNPIPVWSANPDAGFTTVLPIKIFPAKVADLSSLIVKAVV